MLFVDAEQKMAVSKEIAHADQTLFVLSDEQWRAFTEALDRPARHLPRLEKLLREPSVLERTMDSMSAVNDSAILSPEEVAAEIASMRAEKHANSPV
jgi:hypothetical protein